MQFIASKRQYSEALAGKLLQLSLQDWNGMLDQVKRTFGPGLYAWLGGAALLFVVSFFDPGRRAR